jgi:hypothetical protein
LPWRARASSRVSTQNAASIVIDKRHDSTRRLNQLFRRTILAEQVIHHKNLRKTS